MAAKPISIDLQAIWRKYIWPYRSFYLLGGFLILGLIILFGTPLGLYLRDIEQLRQDIQAFGPWGAVIYVAVFLLASLLGLPGSAFMLLAMLLYGSWEGAALTYFAAWLSALATFYWAKLLGGKNAPEAKGWLKKYVEKVAQRPYWSLIVIRTFMQLSPFVGYSLAFSQMKSKDYILGNALALLVPISYMALAYAIFEAGYFS